MQIMIDNHHYHRQLLALVLALIFIAISATPTSAQVDPSKQQQFADNLTSLLYTNNENNEFSSALGVSMAFSLVWPGCTGDAIDEVRQTLGYPEDGSNLRLVWQETTQSMLAGANGECVYGSLNNECDSFAPLLKIANSIWFDDGDVLNATYESVVGDYAMQADFEAEDSPVVVNEWVKNSTNGLIDSIVSEGQPLFPPLVLIAINSIYLKASWMEQFEKSLTNLDIFYDSSSRTTEVSKAHFMHQVEYYAYSHDALSGYQVINLPLENAPLSVIFVLPMVDEADDVSSTELISVLDTLTSTRMALALPKFKFESTYDDGLKDSLMQLGIVSPFTEGTKALCGIFDQASYDCTNLIIDKIIQKTVIDVNEDGVEAAAVTAVMVGVTSVPMEDPILMVLDHPFQFFIYNSDEKLMLFEGRLGMPEIPEAEPQVPLLDAVHSDSDFWSTTFGVSPVDPNTASSNSTTTSSSKATEAATVESQPSSTTTTSTLSSESTTSLTAATAPGEEEILSTSMPSSSSTATPTKTTSSTTSNGSAPLPIEISGSDTNAKFRLSLWTCMICFVYGMGASSYMW